MLAEQLALRLATRRHDPIHPCAVTGQTRSVGVKNQDASDVARHAWRLRNQTGHRVVAVGNPVRSTADSVQGVWSPSHTFEEFSLKIDAESR